jgi:SAM-dependent methyltransferase
MRKHGVDALFNHGNVYARYRPRYPVELASALAELTKTSGVAWDVGTGNGQMAALLSKHFEKIVATDVNANQIEHADRSIANVTYRVMHSEASDQELHEAGLHPGTVDLVCVAQALHWFNFEAWHNVVKKVLKPDGGVYVAITYVLPEISKEFDEVLHHYSENVIAEHWNEHRIWTLDGYAKVPFGELAQFELKPTEVLPPEAMQMVLHWNLHDLIGYTDSWSGVQAFIKKTGKHPLRDNPELLDRFLRTWPAKSVDEKIRCIYPLQMRICRTKGSHSQISSKI